MADRYSAPEAETKYSWLKNILDTFYVSDAEFESHLKKLSRKGITIACHQGCHACCLKSAVPFTAPELTVISWYASEVLSGELRAIVKTRLSEHTQRLECPFLVEMVCSIYPVRPLICRQFFVKTKECEIGEDPLYTRPHDIIQFPRAVIRPVAMKLLDSFGFITQREKQKAFESGFIVDNARDMHEFDWTQVVITMELFDRHS